MTQLPFGVQFGADQSPAVSIETVRNCYVERAGEGAKGRVKVHPIPGLVNVASSLAGRCRGSQEMGGNLYFVLGPTLYKMTPAEVVTSVGTVDGSGLVLMAATETELAICVPGVKGYDFDGSTLLEITDADFLSFGTPSSVTVADGYFVWTMTGSARFYISTNRDVAAYAALDFETAERQSDNLIAAFFDPSRGTLILFGERSLEEWVNTGDSTFPFSRQENAGASVGCAAPRSVVSQDNTVWWVGDDGVIYKLEGLTPKKVSTHAVDHFASNVADLSMVAGFAYDWRGHKFVGWSWPEGTLVFDVATGLWHECKSYREDRWRACGIIRMGTKIYAGDGLSLELSGGNIWRFDKDTYSEGADPLTALLRSPPIHAFPGALVMDRLELDFEAGIGLNTGQGSDPQVMLRWSDDNGKTWSNEKWRKVGKIGERRRRAVWNRCGRFLERTFEVSWSDPVPMTLISADGRINQVGA